LDNKKNPRLTTELDLGVIGPNGKGEEEQKTIHRWLNNIQPLGWQYQISNDLVLNYFVQYEKGISVKKHAEMIAFCNANFGTLYDNAGGGLIFRAGWLNPYFETLSLFKHAEAGKKFRCTFIAKGELKVIGYNATLQGGMFNRNSIYIIPDKNVERIVADVSAGIILSYKRLSLEYTKFYITPEFRNGLDHGWGHINITVCF
jgi:lipid A 3-O-deacylase